MDGVLKIVEMKSLLQTLTSSDISQMAFSVSSCNSRSLTSLSCTAIWNAMAWRQSHSVDFPSWPCLKKKEVQYPVEEAICPYTCLESTDLPAAGGPFSQRIPGDWRRF